MVTVELALGLLAVVTMLGVLTGVVLLGVVKAELQTSSTEVARHLARGDQRAADEALGRAPSGTELSTVTTRKGVEVVLAKEVPIPGLGAVPLSASAFVPWEPGRGP